MIRIEGLTTKQVEMLDKLWSFDTTDEVLEWMKSLSEEDFKMAVTLQELVIDQIQTTMLCHEVLIVGGKPSAHQGATLWNAYKDDIMKDEFGIDSAKKLGVRVAEAALKLK